MKLTQVVPICASLLAFASAPATADDRTGGKKAGQADSSASQGKSSAGGSSASGAARKEGFAKLDKDGDGTINRIEAAADADAKSKFEQLDADRNGRLSRSEYEAWNKAGSAAGSGGKTKH